MASDSLRPSARYEGRRTAFRIVCAVLPFAAMVAAVFAAHAPFLDGTLAFATSRDEFAQMVPGITLVERTLAQGEAWSWSYGLGGDVFTEFTYYYTTSPFFYLQMFVKTLVSAAGGNAVSVVAWKVAFNMVKMLFTMLAMYALMRFEGKSRTLGVLGAILYGASPWFMYNGAVFSFMTDAAFWLPCTALAFRHYQRGGSWGPLSVSIALTVANNFYFGFESCLFYVTFFLMGSYRMHSSWGEFVRAAGKVAAITLVGLLLSAVAFLPSVGALLAADRSPVDVALRAIVSPQEALTMFSQLLLGGSRVFVPVFALLAVFLSWRKLDTLARQKTLLALFWTGALLVPVMGNVMNGMSTGFDRWHYIVAFAVAYAVPDWVVALKSQGRVGVWKGCAVLVILLAAYGFGTRSGSVSSSFCDAGGVGGRFLLVFQAFGVAAVVAWCMLTEHGLCPKKERVVSGTLSVLVLLSVAVPCIGEARSQSVDAVPSNTAAGICRWLFSSDAAMDYGLAKDNGDDGFYRVDNVLANVSQRRADNESWLTGEHTTSAYNSLVNRTLHEWIKRDFDIASCWVTPNTYRGFDDRYFLEIAWDVRYKTNVDADGLGDWGREPVEPYGAYDEQTDGEGNAVLRNGLSTGFDLWYDTTMSAEEWERLDYAERDAALLQTAMVESTEGEYSSASLGETTSICSLSLSDATLVNCETTERGTLAANEGASISFPVSAYTDKEGEYLFSFVARSVSQEAFTMKVNDKSLVKMAHDYAWTYDLDEFSFKLPGSTDQVVLSLDPGEYEIEDMRIAFNSYEEVASWVDDRNACNLEDLEIDGGSIEGTIECGSSGILALSMPYAKGWTCYVDGRKVPLIKVNGVFPGIELDQGSHQVELRFAPPLVLPGAVASAATVAVLVVAFLWRGRKRRVSG